MSFISSQDRRTLITVFITLLIICEMVAYVANTPRPREQFFQLYVLGARHMAADYYPNNKTDRAHIIGNAQIPCDRLSKTQVRSVVRVVVRRHVVGA